MNDSRHPTVQALSFADLRFFVGARFFSEMAHALLAATLAWHVFAVTGSAFQLGLLGLVAFLPVLPMSLLGGAVADTRERRSITATAQVASLLGAALLGLSAVQGVEGLPLLFGMAFALAIALAFERPANAALLPSLVPREIFQSAVVVNSTARNLGTVTGPVAMGFAIEAGGVAPAYGLSVVCFALSVACLLRVHPRAPADLGGAVSLAAIREGIAFVRGRRLILGSMTLDMFAVIFAGATALLPIYAEEILGVGPRGYGLLSASMSLGTFSMTLILLVRPPFARPGRALLAAVLCFGLATLLFGISRSFPLSIAAFVIAGMADQVSMVTRSTIIQLSTPDALRGRVSSVNMIFIGASNELGAAESGFLAALTSATFSVVAGGFACLAALGAIFARVPELRSYRVGDAEEEAATPTR